jgi:hypothetical protein
MVRHQSWVSDKNPTTVAGFWLPSHIISADALSSPKSQTTIDSEHNSQLDQTIAIMKLTIISLVAFAMVSLFPTAMGLSVSITFNRNEVDPNKQCTAEEWSLVSNVLQGIQFRRERKLRRAQAERKLILNRYCGRNCIFIGVNRNRRRELYDQNACSEAKNKVINTLNNQVMPTMSAKPWPHLCKNLIQSQHDLQCYD